MTETERIARTSTQSDVEAVRARFADEVIRMAFEILPENERGESLAAFKEEFTDEELAASIVKFADHFYQAGLAAREGYIGISDRADFEENTWTFEMQGQYAVGAGEYLIIRKD